MVCRRESISRCKGGLLADISYKNDGGWPTEVGLSETGFKSPQVAVVKSNGHKH